MRTTLTSELHISTLYNYKCIAACDKCFPLDIVELLYQVKRSTNPIKDSGVTNSKLTFYVLVSQGYP